MFWNKKATKLPKFKKYYREYLGTWGWGIMLAYDTVNATSYNDARSKPQRFPYVEGDFESVTIVKDEHLGLTDEELSKIYGEQEE